MLSFFKGMKYLALGIKYLLTPGLKRFIVMPIVFNCLLFAGVFYLCYYHVLPYSYHYIDKLPSWLSFLSGVLVTLLIIAFVLFFLVMFTVMFNVIAAPFNGLLSEKVQQLLYKSTIPEVSFIVMAIRAIKRQGQFLWYFIPRLLVMGILFFIPFIQPIFPFIWFLFTAWMLSMQFQDLPMDNNLVCFEDMQRRVKANTMRTLGFGSFINIVSFIPILNILLMPAAVIGSTMLYCDTYRSCAPD